MSNFIFCSDPKNSIAGKTYNFVLIVLNQSSISIKIVIIESSRSFSHITNSKFSKQYFTKFQSRKRFFKLICFISLNIYLIVIFYCYQTSRPVVLLHNLYLQPLVEQFFYKNFLLLILIETILSCSLDLNS